MGSGHDPMLLMEFCEYGSLHDLLKNETMYAGGEICLQIMRDVASGLRYLHSSKPPIFHGDLKGLCPNSINIRTRRYIQSSSHCLTSAFSQPKTF